MKNFILSAVAVVFAGVSMTEAKTSINTSFSLQDTVKKDTVSTPADTTKKEDKKEYSMVQYISEQDTTTTPAAQQSQEQAAPATAENKAEVALNDLPDAVKQTLTADIFKEWVPANAYHVTGGATEHFLIEVKKGEELRTIKIGTDGKVVN